MDGSNHSFQVGLYLSCTSCIKICLCMKIQNVFVFVPFTAIMSVWLFEVSIPETLNRHIGSHHKESQNGLYGSTLERSNPSPFIFKLNRLAALLQHILYVKYYTSLLLQCHSTPVHLHLSHVAKPLLSISSFTLKFPLFPVKRLELSPYYNSDIFFGGGGGCAVAVVLM